MLSPKPTNNTLSSVPAIGSGSSSNTSSNADGDSTPNGLLHGGVVIMVNGRSSFIPIIFGQ